MPNRTPTGAKATRCKATHGDEQCQREKHSEMTSHTWGPKGATKQWNADGTPKPDPSDETVQLPRVVVPEPLPDAQASDYFNGDNASGPNPEHLQAEAREIAERRPDAIAGNGSARPISISGAPGSRLADVSSFSSTLTLLGIPVELQDEFTWYQIAKHAIDSAIEEIIRTRGPSDVALLTAAYDAIGHVVQARGLLSKDGGS
jgi:hypothetical protein